MQYRWSPHIFLHAINSEDSNVVPCNTDEVPTYSCMQSILKIAILFQAAVKRILMFVVILASYLLKIAILFQVAIRWSPYIIQLFSACYLLKIAILFPVVLIYLVFLACYQQKITKLFCTVRQSVQIFSYSCMLSTKDSNFIIRCSLKSSPCI